jgi:serine/threonine protein kinase/tetratricopeptide (TPR) repeat protein
MPDEGRTERNPELFDARTVRPGGPAPEDAAETVVHGAATRPSPTSPGVPCKPATLAEFKRSLVEAELIEAPELERFAAEAPGGVVELARALVKAGKLTPYQASAANQGKTKGLVIGNYFVLDKLGAGGMGVVFKAKHRRLGRVVALKILPPSFAKDREMLLRFRREVDAAARLKHPNVIAAVDADEDRGVNFLAMDYVDGRDLERLVTDRGPLPIGQAVDCVIQAARGLEAAHSGGIIHRDIKPGNLMLDESGTVRVLDLGLARFVEASNPFGQASGPALTQSGSYMGTVDYMAPEQAEDSRSVDGRADVYSLGCTLYFLLTGKPPFEAANVLKRLMAHQERPAPSLLAARRDVPEALEEIYQAMMAKRPGDRPSSMAEVVRRLEASRAPKEARKAQTDLKDLAEEAVKRASPRASKGRDASIFARHDDSAGLQIDNDLSFEDLVMDFREEHHPAPMPVVDEPPPLRRIKPASSRSGHRKKSGRGKPLIALGAFAALALVVAVFLIPGRTPRDGAIEKFPDLRKPVVLEPKREVFQPLFNGKDLTGWKTYSTHPGDWFVEDGTLVGRNGPSHLFTERGDFEDFHLRVEAKINPGGNSGVYFRSEYGLNLVVGGKPGTFPQGYEAQIYDSKGGSDPNQTGSLHGLASVKARLVPPDTWFLMEVIAKGNHFLIKIDGKDAASFTDDRRRYSKGHVALQCIDSGTRVEFRKIEVKELHETPTIAGPESVASMASGPDASLVEVARFEGFTHGWVDGISIAPDGRTMITACEDGKATQWDVASGRELRVLWHPAATRVVEFLPDGRRAVTGCVDGIVRLWDLSSGAEVRRFVEHKDKIDHGLALSRDGLRLVTGSEDRSVILWDVDKERPVRIFKDLPSPIYSVAISPDGRRLLAGGNGSFFVIKVDSGEVRMLLPGHKKGVWAVAFAPDGRHAASGGDDGQVIYWDLEAAKVDYQYDGGNQFVRAVRFDHDGQILRVASQNWNGGHAGELMTWDVKTRQLPTIIPGPQHSNLALMPGGGLATTSGEGVARIWRVAPRLALARDYAKRGKAEEALASYRDEIAARPDDARLRIERGRFLLTQGRGHEADADFARAYDLSSGNLQLFIDAGVWAAGPYPVDSSAPIGPKFIANPDPSNPPPASNGQPRRWVDLPTDNRGRVNLAAITGDEDVAAYVLAVVYVPKQQPAMMMIGTDDQAGFWLNGFSDPFLETKAFSHVDSLYQIRELQPGRNVILVKVVNEKVDFTVNLRITESPVDAVRMLPLLPGDEKWKLVSDAYSKGLARDPSITDPQFFRTAAEAFAQQAKWKEAIGAQERVIELTPDEGTQVDRRRELAQLHLGAGNLAAFRDTSKETIERLQRLKDQDPLLANNVAWLATLVPDVPHVAEAVRIAKFALDKRGGYAEMNTYGCLLYRKGDLAGAERYLRMSIKAQNEVGYVHDWAVLAMIQHRHSKPEARKSLDRARELAKTVEGWSNKAEIVQILDEAEKVLKGPHKP